jgi:hypothetical protein
MREEVAPDGTHRTIVESLDELTAHLAIPDAELVYEIDLAGHKIGDAGMTGLAVILASGALVRKSRFGAISGVQRLMLNSNALGAEGAARLATALSSGGCASLHMLNLNSNWLGDNGAMRVAEALASGGCPALQSVSLGGNEIGPKGATRLAEALATGRCAGLTRLVLDNNKIGAEGAKRLREALSSEQMAEALKANKCQIPQTLRFENQS